MAVKQKKKRNKKYTPKRHIGWIGYGYIEYGNYRCYFEVRFDHLNKEIRKDDDFGEFVIDVLDEFAKDDGITSEATNLKMLSWIEWFQ
jgi:hypothetical protein